MANQKKTFAAYKRSEESYTEWGLETKDLLADMYKDMRASLHGKWGNDKKPKEKTHHAFKRVRGTKHRGGKAHQLAKMRQYLNDV